MPPCRVCSEQTGCTAFIDWTNCVLRFFDTNPAQLRNIFASTRPIASTDSSFCLPRTWVASLSDWSRARVGFCADERLAAMRHSSRGCEVSFVDVPPAHLRLDDRMPRFAAEATPCPGRLRRHRSLRLHGWRVVRFLIGAVVLELGGEQLSITADGTFQFQPRVDGTPYAVAIAQHPAEQQCSVTGGVGALAGSNASNIRVACDGKPLGNLQKISYVKASNTGEVDSFGWALAIDGDTLVVGAPFEDSDASGSRR